MKFTSVEKENRLENINFDLFSLNVTQGLRSLIKEYSLELVEVKASSAGRYAQDEYAILNA